MSITREPQVQSLSTKILVIIFFNFTVFQYRSDSPQVKLYWRHGTANFVQELPNEMLNDLRIRIFRNQKMLKNAKFWFTHSVVSRVSSRNQTLAIAVEKHTKKKPSFFLVQSFQILHFIFSGIAGYHQKAFQIRFKKRFF